MNETIGAILIFLYCLFQIAGCFFIGRAIFRMVKQRRAELAEKEIPHDRRRAR